MSLLNRFSENIDKIIIPVIVVIALVLLYLNFQNGGSEQVANIAPPQDDAWFESQVLAKQDAVVVKFGAEWCPPCKQLDKVIDQYQQRSDGVDVVKVDVDQRGDLASHYRVSGIPKVIMFKNGQPIAQFTGSRSLDQFSGWIEQNR